jgi:glucan phosphoethanolaminetransferase (alkaline phosphatase superfamily)
MIAGFALITIGLIHGVLSADDVRSFFISWGVLVWMLLVLIALNYCLRKYLKKRWLLIHQILAWLISAAAIVHLVMETVYNSSELP